MNETLADRLMRHARDQSESVAFRLSATGEEIQFGNLVHQAQSLAARLPRDVGSIRVGIACERPLDFVVALAACFLAGHAAVPVPVALSRRSAPRASAILTLAKPSHAIVGAKAGEWLLSTLAAAGVTPVVVASDGGRAFADVGQVTGDTPALVQFSSGSTGDPKGIRLRHRNLAANCASIAEAYRLNRDSRALSWLPLHHDMGLIGHVVAAMWTGFRSTLMDPLRFLQRPLSWLQTASVERTTITSAPNFAYEMCSKAALGGIPSDVNLDALETAICGGEPVLPETARRFNSTFETHGLRASCFAPSYGLAEATLLVSSGQTDEGPLFVTTPDGMLTTDLGPPVTSCSVRVVGPTGEELIDGIVGELEVSGASVGERMDADDSGSIGPVLTGDLGFRRGGKLFVTGRRKELIILRGENIYPSDVEAAAMRADEAVAPGGLAAIGTRRDGTEELIVFFEVERNLAPSIAEVATLERTVGETVARTTGFTPAKVIALRYGSLPRTSSGKVRRNQVAAAYQADPQHGVRGRLRVEAYAGEHHGVA